TTHNGIDGASYSAAAVFAHQPAGGRAYAADNRSFPRRLEPKQRIHAMLKTVKSRAEEQFTATQKKDRKALKDKEKARQERADSVARLRGLRLAKEAADKEAAEAEAKKKPSAKKKKPKR
ncbi:MAG TPA: hypothetical protein QF891_04055, partial [Rhodospirillales bacterium]|nr:hypothetical protein [Rhodospirillales bacterium]